MTLFDNTHLIYLGTTFVFLASTMYLVSKLNRKLQNIMFSIAAILCSAGIFYRYGMGLNFTTDINWKSFALQMLQVCNFNFILLPLMLVRRFEGVRQYVIYFSMFAASTTLFSLSHDWANKQWYDPVILNSWLNHTFAIAGPLWMVSARVLKPKKEYILKVTCGVVVYFTIVWIVSNILINNNIISPDKSFSFIYNTLGVPILDLLYKLIPYPYFYLYPLLPIMIIFFYGFAWVFKKYKTIKF